MQGRSLYVQTIDFTHALEHLHDVSHYHDADGTVHYGDSEKASQHAAETAGFAQLAAILPSHASGAAATSSSIGPPFGLVLISDGITSVPIRPPSSIG